MQPTNYGPGMPGQGGPTDPFGQNPYVSLNQPTMPMPKPRHHFPWLPVAFTISVVLLLGALGGFVWAFMGRQDYKSNSDKKVAAAVDAAKKEEADAKEKEFVEREKLPTKEYKTPATYGAVSVIYPKTWSAYVAEAPNNTQMPIDGYFYPNVVPGLASGTAYALRVQISGQNYAQELKQFDSDVKAGRVKVAAYQAPKMPGVTGSRIDGEIAKGQKGTMILLPLRDKTIMVSTQSPQFAGDFEKIVLANLTFAP